MDIKPILFSPKGYIIEVSSRELFLYTIHIKIALTHNIKNYRTQEHWEKTQQEILDLLKQLCETLGKVNIYEQLLIEASTYFTNKEKQNL